ncbi:MAG: acyltransferase family protein [Aetokthonos hydrillicola CCALA 1050]|jgi:peptidoglycan/LPS O-acetylase OafA/YrhL|nr:acyltransferase family protein [Aetokthonos hydrillicola CCALA 1050]
MSIEFKGSLLVLSLAFFVNEIKYKRLFLSVIIGLVAILYRQTGVFYSGFIFGMLLASFDIKPEERSDRRYWLIMAFILALYLGGYRDSKAYVLLSSFNPLCKYISDPIFVYYTIGACILVYILLKSTQLQKIFGARIAVYFGKISFPLYLIHYPLINSIGWSSFSWMQKFLGYNASAGLTFVILLIVCLPLSNILRCTVDEFAIRVSRQFAMVLI